MFVRTCLSLFRVTIIYVDRSHFFGYNHIDNRIPWRRNLIPSHQIVETVQSLRFILSTFVQSKPNNKIVILLKSDIEKWSKPIPVNVTTRADIYTNIMMQKTKQRIVTVPIAKISPSSDKKRQFSPEINILYHNQ